MCEPVWPSCDEGVRLIIYLYIGPRHYMCEPVWPSCDEGVRLIIKRPHFDCASTLLSLLNLWFMDTALSL